MPEEAWISIGSNIEPEHNLPQAVQQLHRVGKLLQVSNVYQNPAIGRENQPDFLNAAALLETDKDAWEFRAILREIEAALKRVRSEDKYAPRTIDLDLCILGSQVIETPEFTIPDPEIPLRSHLIVPLAELNPHMVHPTIGERLVDLADKTIIGADLTPRPDIARKLQHALRKPGPD